MKAMPVVPGAQALRNVDDAITHYRATMQSLLRSASSTPWKRPMTSLRATLPPGGRATPTN